MMKALAWQAPYRIKGIWLYRGVRWGLALVFLYTGAIKLADPASFAVVIEAYGLVPEGLLMPIAIVLPALEAVAAIGLIFDLRGSLSLMAILLVIFIAVLGYGLWMGLAVDCGCFGSEDPEGIAYAGIRPALFRDFVLAGGILLLYGWRHRLRIAPVGLHLSRFINREETHDLVQSAVVQSGARDRDGRGRLRDGNRQGQIRSGSGSGKCCRQTGSRSSAGRL